MTSNNMFAGFERYLPGVLGRGEDGAAKLTEQAMRLRAIGDAAQFAMPRSLGFQLKGMDASVGGGQAFLVGELEKRDPKIREPLASVTYPRDIPIKEGGGWVDTTSNMFVDYAGTGGNGLGIQADNTTTIPIIQANLLKDIYRVFAWGSILRVNFIDLKKLEQVPRSLDDMYDKGVKLFWSKALDQLTYLGPFSSTAFPGLLNNTNITTSSVAAGASGKTQWAYKTPQEILIDINTLMVTTVAAAQYDVTGMANHIVIPWSQYALLLQPVTAAGSVSILTYLLENNIGKTQGVDLKIFPLRWCSGQGSGGTDLMFGYVNNDDRVQLDVTVPIQRIMTVPNISSGGGSYETLFQGQFGVVKFLYTQAAYGSYGI